MSSKILDYGLVILFLMLSVKYGSLFPCTNPSNAESQSPTTTSQPSNDSNQSLSECNNTESEQEAFHEINGCQCRWKDDSESCTSLGVAIYDLYVRIEVDADIPYQFFTLKDLFYSAILEWRGGLNGDLQPPPIDSDFNSGNELKIAHKRCIRLAGQYNFTTSDTENCRWIYNCTQRQNQFPSFYLEAELSNSSTAGSCAPVITRNRRFMRTACASNSSLPHWLDCDCGGVVVGYKHSS